MMCFLVFHAIKCMHVLEVSRASFFPANSSHNKTPWLHVTRLLLLALMLVRRKSAYTKPSYSDNADTIVSSRLLPSCDGCQSPGRRVIPVS
jgi:hypothetical protein